MDNKALRRESPAQTVVVNYLCVHCGGSMRATKFQCFLDGVQHCCENRECGHVEVLDRQYPYIKYQTREATT